MTDEYYTMLHYQYVKELLEKIIKLLETKQTAREKHSGIGYGGL